MTTAEPTETPTKEPEPTEVVELGEGKQWCWRCVIVGPGRSHEHGKIWMTSEDAARVAKVFKEME